MKHGIAMSLWSATLSGLLVLASCHSSYELTKVEGNMITIDSVWDTHPDAKATALLAPYKAKVDDMMYRVMGVSEMTMAKGHPESLLSNLVADVLREAAKEVQGEPADMGLVNMGGLRNIISAGEITCENIYEVLPFENSLCVITLKGIHVKELFAAIAAKRGEGVSGVQIDITEDGKLLNGTIGGKPVEDEKLYTVATIDYLADGNDGMAPLIQADKRLCPDGATLRGLFMDYVDRQTAAGKKITSRMEGRVREVKSVKTEN